VFGAVQSAALESVVAERGATTATDPGTGLDGPAELHEWLRMLFIDQRRSGQPFSVLHLELEGADRITSGYGEEARERIVGAVAALVRGQLREGMRPFRLGEGRLAVVAPGAEPAGVTDLAERLADLVERSQSEGAPRIALTVGVASSPVHASGAERLLEAAEEAAWAARASGRHVAIARASSVQDP
jgi:diguanylate cyclase (GGDEF)-like protein